MIDYATHCQIHHLHDAEQLTPRQIAEQLGLEVRTVRKWLREKTFRPRRSTPRASIIAPYRADVVRLLERHPLSAMQVFQRLRENGYPGGYTTVKELVRRVRPTPPKAYLTLHFEPGQCAQVDWGSYGTVPVGNTQRRLSLFVMVLCYSRLLYLEFTVSQTMEHFLACHQRAFQYFGGCVREVMVDNLKSAVLQRIVGQAPVLNPRYRELADHYGFAIKPCNPRKGNEKGRVENAVGYVKKNLLNGLEITDFSALAPLAQLWMDTVANVRIHGETHKRPREVFDTEEAPRMTPLPSAPPDLSRTVHLRACNRFRIRFDGNRYSVPAEYAGQRLILKAHSDRLCLYHGEKLIARHPRSFERNRDFEDPDHPKALLQQRRSARQQQLLKRFLALSPQAHEYYQGLQQKRANPHHHVRQIVALADIHGPEPVARAITDGLEFKAFSCQYILNLIEQRQRPIAERGALSLTRRQDLLDLDLPAPDLSVYRTGEPSS